MSRLGQQATETDLEDAPPAVRDRVRLFRLLVGLGGALKGKMDRALQGSGVTVQQAHLLTVAGAAPTPLSQGKLAELMGVSHQNVKQIALVLERKGLLTFEAAAEDGRVRRLVPTAKARRLFRRRNRADFDEVAGWFDGLRDAEVRALVTGLRAVVATLEPKPPGAEPPGSRRPRSNAARPVRLRQRPRRAAR